MMVSFQYSACNEKGEKLGSVSVVGFVVFTNCFDGFIGQGSDGGNGDLAKNGGPVHDESPVKSKRVERKYFGKAVAKEEAGNQIAIQGTSSFWKMRCA